MNTFASIASLVCLFIDKVAYNSFWFTLIRYITNITDYIFSADKVIKQKKTHFLAIFLWSHNLVPELLGDLFIKLQFCTFLFYYK